MSSYETLNGTVTSANEKGFKLDGADEWINISQFAKPKPAVPPKGSAVVVEVDSKGFARSVTVVDGSAAPSAFHATGSSVGDSRGHAISRMAALKAWAGFFAGRPEATPADVIRHAMATAAWAETGEVSDGLKRLISPDAAATTAAPTVPSEKQIEAYRQLLGEAKYHEIDVTGFEVTTGLTLEELTTKGRTLRSRVDEKKQAIAAA